MPETDVFLKDFSKLLKSKGTGWGLGSEEALSCESFLHWDGRKEFCTGGGWPAQASGCVVSNRFDPDHDVLWQLGISQPGTGHFVMEFILEY